MVLMACNEQRFMSRVFTDEACDRSLCRCCGRYITTPDEFLVTLDTNDMDGYCRRCELNHPEPFKVERPKLFAGLEKEEFSK
jgi:hypothetical protein